MGGFVDVAVLGASGYTGAELLRLLAGHPVAEVVAVGAGTAAGQRVGSLYPHLAPYADLTFEDLSPQEVAGRADAALLALPHERSAALAPALAEAGVRVVDLSGAFRLEAADYPRWYGFEHPTAAWLEKAVYGLPEAFAEAVAGAELVANPGCYPTAAVLALAPPLREGLLGDGGVTVDAKSGISGAGRRPTDSTHFAAADGSVRPYGAGGRHRHTPEIERALGMAGGRPVAVTFVPHLVPATRGLLATCYAPLAEGAGAADLQGALEAAYADSPFVRVLPAGELPDTKRLTGSNRVEVSATADPRTGTAVLAAALDNLVKGGAGQAVQNLNLMFGLPQATGLEALGLYP